MSIGNRNKSRANTMPVFLAACISMAAVHPLQAEIGCPVRLSDGKLDQGTISISFMNGGKTPIRELNLDCMTLQGQKSNRADCHRESGVFYPGTPYTFRFAYSGKATRTLQVSVQSVRLQDGTIWSATQDQPCKPLKILSK